MKVLALAILRQHGSRTRFVAEQSKDTPSHPRSDATGANNSTPPSPLQPPPSYTLSGRRLSRLPAAREPTGAQARLGHLG